MRPREDEQNQITYLFKLADDLKKKGEVDKAEQVLRQTMEQFPESPRPLITLGRMYSERGDNKEAAKLVKQALEMSPSAIGFFMYSDVLRKAGDIAGAISAVQKSLELDPKLVPAKNMLAILLKDRDH
jgi:tetratricopeptide (TPR) repeat protein